jgi:hypothetical protein
MWRLSIVRAQLLSAGDEDAVFGKRHDSEMTFKLLLITKLRKC